MAFSNRNPLSLPIGAALFPRLASLFAVLCALKLAGLIRGRETFYQEHWRVGESLNIPLFWGWVLFVGGWLVWLGGGVRSAPASSVRRLHLTLACAGLFLFVLTPYALNKSYLQNLFDATLNPADFTSYLLLDFCDHPRYFGAYVIAYLVGWWGCAWLRREYWMVWLVAALWLPFAYFNLRFLAGCPLELAVAAAVGLALIPAAWNGWRLSMWFYVAPACASLGVWLLLAPLDKQISEPNPVFVVLNCLALAGTGVALYLNRASRPFHIVAPFLALSFLFVIHQHYAISSNYNNLVIQGPAILLYLLEEAVPVVGLAGIAVLLASRNPSRRLAWGVVDLFGILLIVWAYVDFRVTGILGVRLTWDVLTMTDSPGLVLKSIRDYFTLSAGGAVAGLVIGYAGVWWLLRAWLNRNGVAVPRKTGLTERGESRVQRFRRWLERYSTLATGLLALSLLAVALHRFGKSDKLSGSAAVRLVGSLPVVKNWSRAPLADAEIRAAWKTLGFPPPVSGAPPRVTASQEPLNVVLIIMESSCNRYLSLFGAPDETQPLLSAYRDRMELFPNFYSVYANSTHARFSVLSGLYPIKPYISYVNPRIPVPCLYEILNQHGYRNYSYDSCFRDYTRFNDYLKGRALDRHEDAATMPGRDSFRKISWGVSEEATLNAMLAGLDELKQAGHPFSLTYTPVTPHLPYDLPEARFKKFAVGLPPVLGGDYEGPFKNELLYMDWILASLLDGLRTRGLLDNTLVVITNDHGEGLGGNHGIIGHGWSLLPELSNNPLIIMDPRHPGYRVNPVLGGQVDILPTVLERLGVPLPDGVPYQGVSLHSAAAMKRQVLYLNSSRDRAMVTHGEYRLETGEAGAREVKRFRIDTRTLPTRFLPLEPGDLGVRKNTEKTLNLFEKLQERLLLDYRRSQTVLNAPGT